MLSDSVLLRRSEKGDIDLFDSRDEFIATRKLGKWHNTILFGDFELEEFYIIEDEKEIIEVLEEARLALNQPLIA